MTNHSNSYDSFQVIAAIIGIIAACLTVIAFAFVFSPHTSNPTQTAIQPTTSFSSEYQPEIIPPPTDTPGPAQTLAIAPTNTPFPMPTPFLSPTIDLEHQPLPDLAVTGISNPVCAPEYEGTKLRFSIFVRNIGRAGTRPFGPFKTAVYLILGQRHYSLDEWKTEFNGVVGSSITEVFNLNPNDDIKFTVVIDLKGNKSFGVEVVANAGEEPIRETDTANNTLTKYYKVYCY